MSITFLTYAFYKSPYSITYFHYFLIYRYPASLFPLDKMYTRFVAYITPLRSTVNFPKSNCSIKNAHHNTQLLLSHFFLFSQLPNFITKCCHKYTSFSYEFCTCFIFLTTIKVYHYANKKRTRHHKQI